MHRSTDTLAARLALARKRLELSQTELAKRAGLKQSVISKIETGRILTTTGIARLARELRVPVAWLELNLPPTPTWLDGVPHLRIVAESPGTYGPAAQQMSSAEVMISPKEIDDWRDVMTGDDQRFTLRAKDDSMRPLLEKGQRGIFDRNAEPMAGKPVLVADGHGDLYIREYRPRTKDHWQAVALHGHDPLDSVADKLTIVAPMVGVLWA